MDKKISNNDKMKKRYRDLKKKGICPACGCGIPNENTYYCDFCTRKRKVRYKEHKKYCQENKICVKCLKPIKNEKIHCEECLKKQREYQTNYYKNKKGVNNVERL